MDEFGAVFNGIAPRRLLFDERKMYKGVSATRLCQRFYLSYAGKLPTDEYTIFAIALHYDDAHRIEESMPEKSSVRLSRNVHERREYIYLMNVEKIKAL